MTNKFMDPTTLIAMVSAHSRSFLTMDAFGSVRYCIGGCGYWDDFRNPEPELKLYPLKESKETDGIVCPDHKVAM